MQIKDSFFLIQKKLSLVYKDSQTCTSYAWWLLEKLTNLPKTHLIMQAEHLSLREEQEKQLAIWLEDIVTHHKPLQYILGTVPFNGLEILVEQPILIPRPETEEWVARLIEQLLQVPSITNKPLTILDMCTGSGCIALALAQALPQATIYAVDNNPQAIALCKRNQTALGLSNVKCMESNLFDAFKQNPPLFDIIVSNPPYIGMHEWQDLAASVREWEDINALIADDTGLHIIKAIIQQAHSFLRPNIALERNNVPQLIIEIGYLQGKPVSEYMKDHGYNIVTIHADSAQNDRIVTGRFVNVATTKKER